MPFMQSSTDHLPYVDPAPSEEAIAAANQLIQAELDSDATATLHASIPALRERNFSDLVDAEHVKLATGEPRDQGIDLSRYEAPDAPAAGDIDGWKISLQRAYTSAEYLRSRETNLALLETYGKNAWLVANSQLEDLLRYLEKEIDAQRIEVEDIERERRNAQGAVAGEMHGLETSWREGVGQLIEVLAAAEGVRGEILQRRRDGAR
jgi:pre-mRNA-splicing factor SPF27